MRQLINNPRFVMAMAAVAGLLIAWQFLPADWGKRWENFLLGEEAQLTAETEELPRQGEIPEAKMYVALPKGLEGDPEKMLESMDLSRAVFPVPASPSEKKWEQQVEGPRFPEGLKLEAVYREGDRKIAIISGLLVEEGDIVRGARAIRIREGDIQGDPANLARVTFEWENREQDLVIGGEQGKLAEKIEEPAPDDSAENAPASSERLLQGELERLQEIQKLLQNPSKLLEGSKQ